MRTDLEVPVPGGRPQAARPPFSRSGPPRVILLRLNKESPRKCSLTPLQQCSTLPLRWIRVSPGGRVELEETTLLHPAGALLGPGDASRPLLLVDCSWRDLPRVLSGVRGRLHRRRLPSGLKTAYPRRSRTFPDPPQGLASIEALHAALAILGQRDDRILDGYRWKHAWLAQNSGRLPA